MVLDFIEILKVIFLGIVEGITEWLPISSTGHMILVDEFITLNMSEAFKEMFFVVIQLGAILAVVVMFWNKMFPFQFKNKAQSIVKKDTFSLWFKVAVACVPSAIMGILFDDYLDAYLQTPIASFCYFIRCKNDKIWSRLISVAAIWGIIRIVINNYQMIRYAEQYLSMNTTVRLVLQMAIYGLILYQTFMLTKKRKNAIEISNTENIENIEKQKNLID